MKNWKILKELTGWIVKRDGSNNTYTMVCFQDSKKEELPHQAETYVTIRDIKSGDDTKVSSDELRITAVKIDLFEKTKSGFVPVLNSMFGTSLYENKKICLQLEEEDIKEKVTETKTTVSP